MSGEIGIMTSISPLRWTTSAPSICYNNRWHRPRNLIAIHEPGGSLTSLPRSCCTCHATSASCAMTTSARDYRRSRGNLSRSQITSPISNARQITPSPAGVSSAGLAAGAPIARPRARASADAAAFGARAPALSVSADAERAPKREQRRTRRHACGRGRCRCRPYPERYRSTRN